MAEYISRKAAMFQINVADFVRDNNFEGGATLLFCDDVVDRLSAIPAADVRPVKRGKWKDAMQSCNDSPHVKCSVCGEYYWRYFKKFNFCPNCGAEMREET